MTQKTCDQFDLQSVLESNAIETKENDVTRHLEVCPDCVKRLEAMAAHPSRWQDLSLLQPTSKIPGNADTKNHNPSSNGTDPSVPLIISQVLQTLAPTDEPTSMGRLGAYEILGVVGHGAMGVVFKALDRSLDRIVALKVMNPTLASCAIARQRFSREAKAAAGVSHPNVISIFGVSSEHVLPYLVMAYIGGESLQQRLNRGGHLELAECLRLGEHVAAGLAAAHQQGLIHRDIKPSNIMLDGGVENGMITDFGLARTIDDATMTRSGAITGTPEYMSPEQARGESLDVSSDLFSLGSLMYAMATGRSPFRAETPWGVMRKIISEQPKSIRELNPAIPTWYCELVRQLLSKAPAERPDAESTHELLKKCLAHVYQPDRNALPEGLAEKPRSSRRFFNSAVFTGVALMTVLALLLFSTTSWLNGFGAPTPQDQLAALTNGRQSDVYKTHEMKFPNPDERGKLIVDINRGFIEVVGHDKPTVVIEVLKPMKDTSSKSESDGLQTVFAPKYDLDSIKKTNTIKLDTYNQNYLLNLRIKVPRESDLSLDTYRSGYIVAKDITGKIEAHSEHSDITLLDLRGAATAFTRNGNIEVRFQEVTPNAPLDFEGYNGIVDLTFPTEFKATVAVSSGTGSYQTEFKLTSGKEQTDLLKTFPKLKSKQSEYQFRLINGGGSPIRIENRNGDIVLRKLKP